MSVIRTERYASAQPEKGICEGSSRVTRGSHEDQGAMPRCRVLSFPPLYLEHIEQIKFSEKVF